LFAKRDLEHNIPVVSELDGVQYDARHRFRKIFLINDDGFGNVICNHPLDEFSVDLTARRPSPNLDALSELGRFCYSRVGPPAHLQSVVVNVANKLPHVSVPKAWHDGVLGSEKG
jgi:hypothetical protein